MKKNPVHPPILESADDPLFAPLDETELRRLTAAGPAGTNTTWATISDGQWDSIDDPPEI